MARVFTGLIRDRDRVRGAGRLRKASPTPFTRNRPLHASDKERATRGISTVDRLAENIVMQAVTKKRKSKAGKILQGALQGFLLGTASQKKKKT